MKIYGQGTSRHRDRPRVIGSPRVWWLGCLTLSLGSASYAQRNLGPDLPEIRMEMSAGSAERIDTIMEVSLPIKARDLAGHTPTLIDQSSAAVIPCQLAPGSTPKLTFISPGALPAGTTRVFRLLWDQSPPTTGAEPSNAEPQDGRLRAELLQGGISLSSGGNPIARYRHEADPAPEGESPLYARSAFVYPLWSPQGSELAMTRPPDHFHHMGLWHAWTETRFEGQPVDFWNLKKGLGTVRFKSFDWRNSGPVWCGLSAQQEHVALKTTSGEKVVLSETFLLRAWRLPFGYVLDYDFTQKNVTNSPLELPTYRYGGGVGYRGPASWNRENSDYLTSEGKKRDDSHSTRARWVRMHGPGKEKMASVSILCHPQNADAPQPIRTWNDDKQGKVFFNYCPSQMNALTIEPGKLFAARYRLILADDIIDPAVLNRLWDDYAVPPAVRLMR